MSIPEIIKTEYASSGVIKKCLLVYKPRYKIANTFNKKFLSNRELLIIYYDCQNFNFD